MTLPEPTLSQSPTVQRRRLRFELRNARDAAHLTQEQVAQEMDWSLSKVIRIEKGDVGISTNDLRALMRFYGVTDRERIAGLVELAKASRQKSWWHNYRDKLPAQLIKLMGYEAEAARIVYVSSITIPGLLQTEDYARTILMGASPYRPSDDEIEYNLEFRLRRQEEVFNSERNPQTVVEAILDEGALHRIMGDRETTVEQLDHLTTLTESGKAVLRIVPFSAGAHPGMFSTFTIIQFDDPIADDIMYADQLSGLLMFRDIPDETDMFWGALDRVRSTALNPDQSVEMIKKIRHEILPD